MSRLHAVKRPHDTSPAATPASQNTVNKSLTPNRTRRLTENDEYAAFARRVLRAYSRRVALGDIETLTLVVVLADELDDDIKYLAAYAARLRGKDIAA